MGIEFCPITYPRVENSFIPASLSGKTRWVLGFRVPVAILMYVIEEEVGGSLDGDLGD